MSFKYNYKTIFKMKTALLITFLYILSINTVAFSEVTCIRVRLNKKKLPKLITKVFPESCPRRFVEIKDSTEQGPKGDTGAQGPKGDNGSDGADGADGSDIYQRTIVVPAGDTPTNNGQALIAAATGLSGTASAPRMIELESGTYDLGGSILALGAFVSIRGADKQGTIVQSTSTASVIDANNGSSIRNMSILGTSISTGSASGIVRIDEVDDVLIENVKMTSAGRGVLIEQCSGVRIQNIDITAVDYAINNDQDSIDTMVLDSRITSSGDSAIDFGFDGSHTIVERCIVTATANNESALRSAGGNGTIRHSTLISTLAGTAESSNGNTNIIISQTYIDVAVPFGTHFTSGTASCTANSTATTFSATSCI